jgi:ribose-phosphate pyrophosphokinase
MDKPAFRVFAGNAHPGLAEAICRELGVPLGRAHIARFPDGEIDCKVEVDVRGTDVFIIQPTCPPVNENLMELLVMIDCLRRASAERITAVIPYFGYARQDRKAEGRVPITAKLVANLLASSGASRVLTMDLHASQIQGFFDIPVDHLYAAPVMIEYFRQLGLPDVVVVSPDVGSVKMCRAYAKRLDCPLAIVDKRRMGPQEIDVLHLIGEIEGKTAVLVDDMIATGTSITEAAKAVLQHGAREAFICATHPVLCGPAVQRLRASPVREIVVSDSIPLGEKQIPRLRVLSVARMLAEAIHRIHRRQSVSSLFV